MKVSVIVPVYNTSKYLKRCLNSISNQSLTDIEIIIINDGSTDSSLNIIKEFINNDSRIKLINKDNGGLSSARNAGLKIASGEYIVHIDSDDWIESSYLFDAYENAVNYNLDIVVTDVYWDWDNKKIEYHKDLDILEGKIISSEEYLDLFFTGKVRSSVWNKMYRRELYICNGIYHPENISLGEDMSTTPRLAFYADRIGKINHAYVHYIQNQDSITKNATEKNLNEIKIALEILKVFFKNRDMDTFEIRTLLYILLNYDFRKKSDILDETLNRYYSLSHNKYAVSKLDFNLKIITIIMKYIPNYNVLIFIRWVKRVLGM